MREHHPEITPVFSVFNPFLSITVEHLSYLSQVLFCAFLREKIFRDKKHFRKNLLENSKIEINQPSVILVKICAKILTKTLAERNIFVKTNMFTCVIFVYFRKQASARNLSQSTIYSNLFSFLKQPA
jgi:hypothetical protein